MPVVIRQLMHSIAEDFTFTILTINQIVMKKILIVLGVLVFLGFIIYSVFSSAYNNMVDKEEATTSQWASVESQYQRRLDLIPNLVATVKGVAELEQETLTQLIEARAKVGTVQVNADELTPESIQQFQEAQAGLSSAISRLLVVVENYPDLKSPQSFLELQAQLEGTENRINKARDDFNAVVQDYNTYIRKFPNNMIAGMFGFEKKGYFQADPGSEVAPKVEF